MKKIRIYYFFIESLSEKLGMDAKKVNKLIKDTNSE